MTAEIAASDAGVGKGAFGFMRDAAEAAVSSPEARAALSSCENFMAFERGRGECCGRCRPERRRGCTTMGN